MKKGKKKMTENINLQNNQPTVKGGLMSRFNHNNIFDVDTKDFKWVDLKTLINTDPDKIYPLLGLFTKGSKFGKEPDAIIDGRSEEHTSELQSRFDLVCRLLLEKNK